jgi:predicted DsbA family dithiol-disulfide isomerase
VNTPANPIPVRLTIDIWSDVMCPWCVIGYKQLEQALDGLAGEIEADLRWHPFELNPDLPAEGEDAATHMLRKYGRGPDEASTNRMVAMAAEAGYDIRYQGEGEEPPRMLWNTFLAHKLLGWALAEHGAEAQTRLKLALFDAHFQQRRNIADAAVLIDVAEAAGLDRAGAAAALADEELGRTVRVEEREARAMEINAVPAMVINSRYMIPGAQGAETYTDLLRKVVARGG